jgi:hypothetical protein
MKKKIIIVAVLLLLGGGYVAKAKLMPKKVVKMKVNGEVYLMPKQFMINLQAPGGAGRAPGPERRRHRRRDHRLGRRRRHPPRGGGHPLDHHQSADRRSDLGPARPDGSRRDSEGDPQVDQHSDR